MADFDVHTSQIDELENILSNVVTDHRLAPLSRNGRFDGGFQFHGLGDLGIFNLSFGRELSARLGPETDDDRIGFALSRNERGRLLRGGEEIEISSSKAVVFPSGPARMLHFSENCEVHALVMNRTNVTRHCAKLLGHHIEGLVEFEIGFDLDTAAGQSWLRLFDYARLELSNPVSLVRYIDAARQQLEQTLVTAFLLSHRHNYSDQLLQPQSTAAPFYVKRAEAYIEAHFAEPLSLADIAAHAGVSARSLQNGFQNFRSMTPMAFLRSVRLRHAHHALKVADPRVATVTEIALLCGFGHMGEFASLYKRTFGVTPRRTLTKAA